ncbi:MAG: enoyl-CoA hydratase/isomerase family protein [Deltaproteobacteria bacterium]|nr:enoyl-CoA hydratase/isomerase family protein [Deltaproteobacteria bacterium]
MEPTVIYESNEGICSLTLNRPDVFNALNLQLVKDLISALRKAESEPDVRVVILKGAGKAWCAGGDLEELLELTEGSAADRRAYLLDFKGMIDTVRGISKPVIASVQGACVGGGNELNIACDLTIASEKAKFGQAGPRVGSMPAFGVPQNLQILVGEKRSREITYLCRLYKAREAEAMGWINKAVPAEDLEKETEKWAKEIVEKSPTAIALGKKMHNVYYDLLSSSAEIGVEMLTFFWGTEEAKEGMLAFKEKRQPVFKP